MTTNRALAYDHTGMIAGLKKSKRLESCSTIDTIPIFLVTEPLCDFKHTQRSLFSAALAFLKAIVNTIAANKKSFSFQSFVLTGLVTFWLARFRRKWRVNFSYVEEILVSPSRVIAVEATQDFHPTFSGIQGKNLKKETARRKNHEPVLRKCWKFFRK